MNDDKLKDAWNEMSYKFPSSISPDFEKVKKLRPTSIQDKIRKIFQLDLILKSVAAIMLIIDLYFYINDHDVVFVIVVGIIVLVFMTSLELKILRQLDTSSEPGRPTRETLSDFTVFISRKSLLLATVVASSALLFFVAGVLLYFQVAYGYLKALTLERFVVFGVLCLIAVIARYARVKSQFKYHIQHLSAFLADLNDNALLWVSESIEGKRKQDLLIIGLTTAVLALGFLVMIIVLKSVAVI